MHQIFHVSKGAKTVEDPFTYDESGLTSVRVPRARSLGPAPGRRPTRTKLASMRGNTVMHKYLRVRVDVRAPAAPPRDVKKLGVARISALYELGLNTFLLKYILKL